MKVIVEIERCPEDRDIYTSVYSSWDAVIRKQAEFYNGDIEKATEIIEAIRNGTWDFDGGVVTEYREIEVDGTLSS